MNKKDNNIPEKIIGEMLLHKKITVSIAESCTGGLISSRLTDISGSSAYIKLNLVTYSNDAKIKTLGIQPELIKNYGAVSEPVAKAMAEKVRLVAQTDIGLGVTGIAGPDGGTPEKPVGLVYIGISDGNQTKVYKVNINPAFSRLIIKHEASEHALLFLKLFLQNI
ncbi:MAG TPA: nicotinamide-nucleotide amidohydrolase family protein [Candidatus Gastranaerophilales bacterium]|nr:nicotinamide-nucleotide amidohydrolase family protein [Candidatus Gastranaerophilales bacterium]